MLVFRWGSLRKSAWSRANRFSPSGRLKGICQLLESGKSMKRELYVSTYVKAQMQAQCGATRNGAEGLCNGTTPKVEQPRSLHFWRRGRFGPHALCAEQSLTLLSTFDVSASATPLTEPKKSCRQEEEDNGVWVTVQAHTFSATAGDPGSSLQAPNGLGAASRVVSRTSPLPPKKETCWRVAFCSSPISQSTNQAKAIGQLGDRPPQLSIS